MALATGRKNTARETIVGENKWKKGEEKKRQSRGRGDKEEAKIVAGNI